VFLAWTFEQNGLFAEAIGESLDALRLVPSPATRAHLAHMPHPAGS